jgi:hypothetical protein
MNWQRVLEPDVLVFLIPITVILVGGIVAVTKLWIRHRERLAMIEHGIHPDYPPGPGVSGRSTDDASGPITDAEVR